MLVAIEYCLLYSRLDPARAVAPESCVRAWNATTNGQTRRTFNIDARELDGTWRQSMWMGKIGGACALVYISAGGAGVLWRQDGPAFSVLLLRPTSEQYRFAAKADVEPNVTVSLTSDNSLLADPAMGSVSTPAQ
jgi:hypothetical protein